MGNRLESRWRLDSRRPVVLGPFIALALMVGACSGGVDAVVAPAPTPEAAGVAVPDETLEADAVVEPDPSVDDERVEDYAPPVAEELNPDAIVASAPWFTVFGYAGGAGFDGPLQDVSSDGSLWLVDDGDQPSVLLAAEAGEVSRLSGVVGTASLSGDGKYVVYSSGEECTVSDTSCDSFNDERHMLQVSTGEVQDLGAMRSPVLINTSGDVVVGLVGNSEGPPVEESIDWADGSTTASRLLFGELGELPPSWFQGPQLYALDGSGEVILYGPWIEDDFVTRDAFFSLLTPQGAVHLVGEEAFGVTWPEAEIATAGDVVVFPTTTGMTSVVTSDGSRRHYILDEFDRFVATFRIAGNTVVAMTNTDRFVDGPTEVIEFRLGANVFEQSGDVLFRIPDPALPQTVGRGGLMLQASADGTALGVSVLVEDLDHPNGQSWLNVIVDLEARPPGSFVEMTAQGVVRDVVDQDVSTPNDPEADASLAEYLAAVSELGADLVAYQAVLNDSGGGPADLAELWRDASSVFAALDPPAEAIEIQEGWLTLTAGFPEVFEALAAAFELTDPVEAQRVVDAFLLDSAELGAAAISLDEAQLSLTLEALEGRDDPMTAYLVQILGLQQDAVPIAEEMFAALTEAVTDPAGAVGRMLGAVDDMRQFADGWALIQAPEGAVGLHRARLRLFHDFESVFDDFNDVIETNVEPSNVLLRQLDKLATDSQHLNAAMSRFTAEVLRGAG